MEGFGFKHAVGGLELGRINVAARGVGLAHGALRDALRDSQERRTFGKPICQHQAIQLKLADMATRVEAARLLVDQAARKYDTVSAAIWRPAWRNCSPPRPRSKTVSTPCVCSADTAYYRDAPLMCIGEGTNEMQCIIVARQLVERNPL